MGSPHVSVVTPVHNGGRYLAECIRSVVSQTYGNWTHVVVDNASTDETPEVAQRLAATDPRITYLRFDEAVDVNESHNRAFRAADRSSDFVKVVQADDWLYPECLERMVRVALEDDSIGVVSAYQRWGESVHLVGVPYDEHVFQGREILRLGLIGESNVTGNPSAVLYRTSVLPEDGGFYESGLVHADTEAAYRVLSRWNLGFIHQVLTYARRQPGSRMTRVDRVTTGIGEGVLFLVRYGSDVLAPDEYRLVLRRELARLVRFHMTQAARPSRLVDREFLDFHRGVSTKISQEAGARDRDVVWAMRLVNLLLSRGGIARTLTRGDVREDRAQALS
jgi:glycosyltransferase involved in cell wall biosynthesis